jgi:hypothetical protein
MRRCVLLLSRCDTVLGVHRLCPHLSINIRRNEASRFIVDKTVNERLLWRSGSERFTTSIIDVLLFVTVVIQGHACLNGFFNVRTNPTPNPNPNPNPSTCLAHFVASKKRTRLVLFALGKQQRRQSQRQLLLPLPRP